MSVGTRLSTLALALTFAFCAFNVPALADEGDPFLDSCSATATNDPCTTDGRGRVMSTGISPDGKMVVFGSYDSADANLVNGLLVYNRDAATGKLTFANCFSTTGNSGACTTVPSLSYSLQAVFTPDGRSLYLAETDNGRLGAFERDPATNTLSYSGCFGSGVGCTAVTGGLSTIWGLAADNNAVYARYLGGLAVFSRGSGTNHPLTQFSPPNGCLTEAAVANCTDAVGLGGATFQVAMTSKRLFVGENQPGGITVLNRASDGSLTQLIGTSGGCISKNGHSGADDGNPPSNIECVDGADQLSGQAVKADPLGKNVYVSGDTAVLGYSVDPDTGILTQIQCLTEAGGGGCGQGRQVTNGYNFASTSDASELILGSSSGGSMAFFKRDPATGLLTQRAGVKGCVTLDGSSGTCDKLAGLDMYIGVAVAPNDLQFYVNSYSGGASLTATFIRNFKPTCSDVSADVPFQTATQIAFACSDVNGDKITYSTPPAATAGTLGAPDQDAAKVYYNPFSAFTGADSFIYTATDTRGAASTAKASLNVLPAPTPAPAPPTGAAPGPQPSGATPRINSRIRAKWRAKKAFTTVRELSVLTVPNGATVTVGCTGKGCPFKTKKVRAAKSGPVALAKFFKKKSRASKLKVKTKITISITKPGSIGRRVVYTVRSGKSPSSKAACLAPGTNRTTAC